VAVWRGVGRETVESVAEDGGAEEFGTEEAELVFVACFGTQPEEGDVEGFLGMGREDRKEVSRRVGREGS